MEDIPDETVKVPDIEIVNEGGPSIEVFIPVLLFLLAILYLASDVS